MLKDKQTPIFRGPHSQNAKVTVRLNAFFCDQTGNFILDGWDSGLEEEIGDDDYYYQVVVHKKDKDKLFATLKAMYELPETETQDAIDDMLLIKLIKLHCASSYGASELMRLCEKNTISHEWVREGGWG